jgi:hypothetical protein
MKNAYLHIRINEYEKNLIESKATKLKMCISEYIRFVTLIHAIYNDEDIAKIKKATGL